MSVISTDVGANLCIHGFFARAYQGHMTNINLHTKVT